MYHYCDALLVTCEDFRLHQRKDGRNYLLDFIKQLKMDCDIITRAGGIKDLVHYDKKEFRDSLERDIMVSLNLHNSHTIILLNHEDCGAYSNFNFSSREEELQQHYNDLKEAQKILSSQYSNKKIELYFAELLPNTKDDFIIKKIN